MMNFKRDIARIVAPATGMEERAIEDVVTLPQHANHGDFSFPCFPLAKTRRQPPQRIASELAATLIPPPGFAKIEAMGGYLNFFVDKGEFSRRVLTEVLTRGEEYGCSAAGAGKTVVIDYSSPNMGKELAFHHLRGTMIGGGLSRIFAKLGHPVVRVNHLGDWGTSYGKLIVMFLREGLDEKNLPGLTLEKLNDLYRAFDRVSRENPGLEDEARAAFARLESGDPLYRKLWASFREVTLRELRRLYEILNVDFDVWMGEAFFADRIDPVVSLLQSRGLLRESRGAEVVDLSEADMPPALIRKTDGSTLYVTRDIAAALYRHEEYSFDRCLYVVDNGQSLHFRQLFKVLELLGFDWSSRCEHVPFGLVLHKSVEGAWEKGKTRSGHVSLLKDVLAAAREKILSIMAEKNPRAGKDGNLALQIAVGALVFSEMKNRRLNDIRFEWEQALSFEGDSGPYVQNAHVRLCSVLRKAGIDTSISFNTKDLEDVRWERLTDDASFAISDLLAQFPDRVAAAGMARDPCILAQFALAIADTTHHFLHARRILGSEEERERLLLARAAQSVLEQSLELTGVPAIKSM